MIDRIFSLSGDIRYAAVYRDGQLESRSRAGLEDASSVDTDRYEELLVNPVMLTAASQRGNIDCGGLDYLLVRYGSFFQFILPLPWGHVSVCIAKQADPIAIGLKIRSLFRPDDDAAR